METIDEKFTTIVAATTQALHCKCKPTMTIHDAIKVGKGLLSILRACENVERALNSPSLYD